ncbi:oxidoreductase [Yinghuangia sp. ASG 101]|uniref:oxidoreductase n=1 Tax=Yinghuangia sp. ASG 101 TaxID=2896848 RepID=UPI001E3E7358|nr:oxidoreductase [Yinghuangia sp. ASG 101]UGQ10082.1 oxidoreductase [Yinghuangia sp. ASG 101]
MAEQRYPNDLSAPERRVWDAYRNGERCVLGGAVPDPAARGGPFLTEDAGADWGPERTVRADVLARLLVGGPDPAPGRVPALDLAGARVVGDLNLRGARVDAYVELSGCRFEGRVLLNDAVTGTFRLIGCTVPAIRARRVRVGGELSVTLCRVGRGIILTDAAIETDLILNGSRVAPMSDGHAVAADGLVVDRDLSANGPFHSTGVVNLRSARIGGRVTFYRARLDALPGTNARGFRHLALDAAGLVVEQTLHLSDSPTGSGSFRFSDARFGDALVISYATILREPEEELLMWRVTAGTLSLDMTPNPRGRVVLRGARLDTLTDTPDTWPTGVGRVTIGGMTYAALRSERPMGLARRLAWLADATADYEPQPYEQLAAAYRASGHDEEARAVLLAKQRRNRETLRFPGRVWGHVQDAAIGYGYRPARALLWLVALIAVGTLAFAIDRPTPVKADEAPHWNAFFYTVDLLLPVVGFGQEAAWNPGGWAQWAAYTLVMLGWVLAGAAAAGATRVMNRA